MRLYSLELVNWACHRKLNINLADGLQIIGRNGTGKSSILNAIRFIYAKDARKYLNKIRNGTRSARVKLAFKMDSSLYEIEKKIYLDKNKSSTATMTLNGKLISDNPTSVYNRLQKEILPENIMEKLVYVPQGELTGLIEDLDRKGGRQELDSLLGLDVFQRVYEGTQKEYREKKGGYEILYNEMLKYPQDTELNIRKEIDELNKRENNLSKINKEKKALINKIGKKIAELKNELNIMQKTRKIRDESEKKIIQLTGEIKASENRLKQYNKALTQIEDKIKYQAKLEKKRDELIKYESFNKLLDELVISEEKLPDKTKHKTKIKQLKALKTPNQDMLAEKYEKKKSVYLDAERKKAIIKQTLEETRKYLTNLHELNIDAKCPRCGQKLTIKHLSREEKTAKEKITSLEAEAGEVDIILIKHRSELKRLENAVSDAKKKQIEYRHLRDEIRQLENEEKRLNDTIKSLKTALKLKGYAGESPQLVDDKIRELNLLRGEIRNIREETTKIDEYQTEIKETRKNLVKQSDIKKQLMIKLKGLVFDEITYEGLVAEREKMQADESTLKVLVQKNESDIRETLNRIGELKEKRKQYLMLQGRVNESKDIMNLFKQARDEIYHPSKGIRRYYRELYVRKLGMLLTYYFKRINNNPKFREISFDEDYKIEIKSTEGLFGLAQLSGGEKAQLAVAFRIALIELLSPVRILMLDEPFGSLDAEHRELMAQALNKVSQDGQLILVTHVSVDCLDLPNKIMLEGY